MKCHFLKSELFLHTIYRTNSGKFPQKNIYRGKLQLLFEDFEVRMRYAIKTECKHKPEGARLCM